MFTRASEAEDEGLVSSHCNKRRVVDAISAQFSLVDVSLRKGERTRAQARPQGSPEGDLMYLP